MSEAATAGDSPGSIGFPVPLAALPFTPVEPFDQYPPLEHLGLIGDGTTAALVSRSGAVEWLCLPRFDSPALFCALLDRARGGMLRIAPEGLLAARQQYEPDTAVLVTEMRSAGGTVRVTDSMTLRPDADLRQQSAACASELLRLVQVVEGAVTLTLQLRPRGGARMLRNGGSWRVHCPERADIPLWFSSTSPIVGPDTRIHLRAGETVAVSLSWSDQPAPLDNTSAEARLQATASAWKRWWRQVVYEGPHAALVKRSALTLKLLDHFESGAIVAAPTSSLPEAIDGTRNWDYRYAWIRDAAFSVYALSRIGLADEAAGFTRWALDAFERGERPRVLYTVDGDAPPPEREDPELEGYRQSAPVRWGNLAAEQRQHDIYGEVLDCALQWVKLSPALDTALWTRLRRLVERARVAWRDPDHGIWEVRTPGRVFTYSAALCHVALERGARMVEHFGLEGDAPAWRRDADVIRDAILNEAWDPQREALTEHLGGGGGVDASLLTLPLRRVIPARHPRMIATTRAVRAELGAGRGLLYRYLPGISPDGLPGHEGAFLLCSFWMVDNLTYQGEVDEAMALYDSLCARANPLGLLPEQIDPASGAFLGNYPQAFSHVGVISSGVNLARALTSAEAAPASR